MHKRVPPGPTWTGKPWQNGTNETFNGRFRAEILSLALFRWPSSPSGSPLLAHAVEMPSGESPRAVARRRGHMKSATRRWSFGRAGLVAAVLMMFPVGNVRATEDRPTGEIDDLPPVDTARDRWALGCGRTKGCGVFAASGELGFLPPGEIATTRTTTGGFDVAVLASGSRWPVLLGIGGGVHYVHREYDLTAAVPTDDGSTRLAAASSSLQVRHIQGIVRVQPFWWRVRPYLEGFFGFGGLWTELTLDDPTIVPGAEFEPERARKAGMYFGGAAGVEAQVIGRADGPGLTVSLGVRRIYAGPYDHIQVDRTAPAPNTVGTSSILALWAPFLSIGVTL